MNGEKDSTVPASVMMMNAGLHFFCLHELTIVTIVRIILIISPIIIKGPRK